jgi:hypothetical protein
VFIIPYFFEGAKLRQLRFLARKNRHYHPCLQKILCKNWQLYLILSCWIKINSLKKNELPSIYWCVFFDLMGLLTYLIPGLGEFFDIGWAPIAGLAFFWLFKKNRFALLGGIFSFLEEISPGLDFIPTFTIGWFLRRNELKKSLL